VWFVGMVLKITRLQKSLCCKGFLTFRGSGGESVRKIALILFMFCGRFKPYPRLYLRPCPPNYPFSPKAKVTRSNRVGCANLRSCTTPLAIGTQTPYQTAHGTCYSSPRVTQEGLDAWSPLTALNRAMVDWLVPIWSASSVGEQREIDFDAQSFTSRSASHFGHWVESKCNFTDVLESLVRRERLHELPRPNIAIQSRKLALAEVT
jgi:hypothetical protein